MNKLIKELRIEACKWASINVQGIDYENLCDEKLAELIIRECVKRAQGCHLAEGYDPTIVGDFELGYKKGIDKVSSQILKHFGVK